MIVYLEYLLLCCQRFKEVAMSLNVVQIFNLGERGRRYV